MTEPPGKKPEPPRDSEHARVLSEVLEDQKRRKEAREGASAKAAERGSDTSFFVQVGLLVSGTMFFYLLFFSPTWIAPDAAPPVSAQRTEDSLRFYLFLMAQNVDAYREDNGRLPDSLEEIPNAKPGVEYVRLSARDYRLRFADGDIALTYESSQDPEEFVGSAASSVLGSAGQTSPGPGDAP